MRRASPVLSALAAAGALALPAAAQRAAAPVTLTLSRPDAEYAEPFTAVAGVRELRDGRVIVADRTEKTIQLLDLATGEARRIGIEGGGPNEYRVPTAIFAMPGDSTLVFDLGNTRFLVLAPDGTPVRTFSTLDPTSGDLRLLIPRAGDGAGNLYFLDRGLGRRDGGPVEAPDSGTVLRYDLKTKALAPVGRVALPPMNVSASGGASERRVMVRMSTPFAAQDDWTVGLDGRLALVRHEPYRVEWLAPNGQRVVGPTIPYRKLAVTDEDKAEYRERQRSATAVGMAVRVGGAPGQRGGGGGGVTVAPSAIRPQEPTDWPEFKPPFVANASTVGPDGRLWVLRSRPAGDDVPTYDLFDGYGKPAGTVKLPPDTRLVGFGRNSAYVVRTDENDLQYLQRYKLF